MREAVKITIEEWAGDNIISLMDDQIDGGMRMELENSTGIIHRIDDLGRVVIPKEMRRQLRIQVGDALEETIITKDGVPVGVAIRRYDKIKPVKNSIESLMIVIRNERYDLNLSSDTFTKVMNSLNDVYKILNEVNENDNRK